MIHSHSDIYIPTNFDGYSHLETVLKRFWMWRDHAITSSVMQERQCLILICISTTFDNCSLLESYATTFLFCHVITWSKVILSVHGSYFTVPTNFSSHTVLFFKLWHDNIKNWYCKRYSYYQMSQKTVIIKLLQSATEVC